MKLALLFLTYGAIFHTDHWQDFLKNHKQLYSTYVHSKEPLPESSPFKQYELKKKIPTTWENTMKAQLELLRVAFEDKNNKKFIFLSESHLPLRTFDDTYKVVVEPDESLFYYENSPHCIPGNPSYQEVRDIKEIPPEEQYLNAQWVVLNRKHTEAMIKDYQDNHIIKIVEKYHCDNEHYPSTFLAQKKLLYEVCKQDTTYVKWIPNTSHQHEFTDLTKKQDSKLFAEAMNGKCVFARKFAKDCNLKPIEQQLAYRSTQKALTNDEKNKN